MTDANNTKSNFSEYQPFEKKHSFETFKSIIIVFQHEKSQKIIYEGEKKNISKNATILKKEERTIKQ